MYQRILVPVEHSEYDEVILSHIRKFARSCNAQSIVLIHVADGWAARNINQLDLRESEEMKSDRLYLEQTVGKLRAQGLTVSAHLALGDPPAEILKTAEAEQCELIAMTSHGHRLIGDIIFGSTIHEVRHKATIPLLLVRAAGK